MLKRTVSVQLTDNIAAFKMHQSHVSIEKCDDSVTHHFAFLIAFNCLLVSSGIQRISSEHASQPANHLHFLLYQYLGYMYGIAFD